MSKFIFPIIATALLVFGFTGLAEKFDVAYAKAIDATSLDSSSGNIIIQNRKTR